MVGFISDKTKNIDKTLERLAKEHNRTDIKSVREGEAQPSRSSGNVQWGTPGNFPLDTIQSVRGEKVGIVPGRDSRFNQLKPASVIRDHENLQLPREALEALKRK